MLNEVADHLGAEIGVATMFLPTLEAQIITDHCIVAVATVRLADMSANLPAGSYIVAGVHRPNVVRWSVATIFAA